MGAPLFWADCDAAAIAVVHAIGSSCDTGAMTRAILVHGLGDALAAAAAADALGVELVLVSAEAAGGYAGAGWWRAITERVRRAYPDLVLTAVLDCGDNPGWTLAAIRAGIADIAVSGDPSVTEKLSSIAEQTGARIWINRPEKLDLRGRRDATVACREWLRVPSLHSR